ncbi:MAG: rhomboid family intramembrane serine protease [Candidatus Bathyarchaeales archaeon]
MAVKLKRSISVPVGGSIGYRKIPFATLTLIAVNIAVYALTSYENFFLEVSDYWVNLGGFVPALMTTPSQFYRIFSSMFLHADFFHILFNMYFLYLFGKSIEDTLGTARFLALYFAAGVAASLFHTAFSFLGGFTAYIIPAIGASGAISGILGAYLLLYPGTSLVMGWFFFIFPIFVRVKAAYYLLFWFAIQLLYGFLTPLGGTAFFAHVGGFVAGIAVLLVLSNKDRMRQLKLAQQVFALPWIFIPRKTGGLGRAAKTVITVFLVALLAGTAYASIGLTGQGDVKSVTIEYSLNGNAAMDYVGIQTQHIEEDIFSVSSDATRVLLNRLYAAGLIYDEAKTGEEKVFSSWEGELPVKITVGTTVRIVYVNTTIQEFSGKYDAEGFVEYCEGTLTTYAISIQVYGNIYQVIPSEPLTYTFKLASKTVNLNAVTQYAAFPSLLLTAAALGVVVKKDKDLTIIGEEHETARGFLGFPI